MGSFRKMGSFKNSKELQPRILAKPLANPKNKGEENSFWGDGGSGGRAVVRRVHWKELGVQSVVVAFH